MKNLRSKVFWVLVGAVSMWIAIEFGLFGLIQKIPSPNWAGIWNWIKVNSLPMIVGIVIGVVGNKLYLFFKDGTAILPRSRKSTKSEEEKQKTETQETRRSRR